MAANDKKMFRASQVAEINAVALYRTFAKMSKDEELKKIFLDAAADEGRHAAILSEYTHQKIKPMKIVPAVAAVFYKLTPKKVLIPLIAKVEISGGDSYKPLIKDYPSFEKMMNDEYRHGKLMGDYINK